MHLLELKAKERVNVPATQEQILNVVKRESTVRRKFALSMRTCLLVPSMGETHHPSKCGENSAIGETRSRIDILPIF